MISKSLQLVCIPHSSQLFLHHIFISDVTSFLWLFDHSLPHVTTFLLLFFIFHYNFWPLPPKIWWRQLWMAQRLKVFFFIFHSDFQIQIFSSRFLSSTDFLGWLPGGFLETYKYIVQTGIIHEGPKQAPSKPLKVFEKNYLLKKIWL